MPNRTELSAIKPKTAVAGTDRPLDYNNESRPIYEPMILAGR